MKAVILTPLDIPDLIECANTLSRQGQLAISTQRYSYLDIADDYIHQLFPILEKHCHNLDIKKPDYFKKYTMGAHITVIYPEEKRVLTQQELGQTHAFQIKGLFSGILGKREYYVLTVDAPSLRRLRYNHVLPDMLLFKEHLIDFHITLAVRDIIV